MTLFSTPDMRRTLNWRGTSLNAGILYVPGPLVSCRPGGLIHACSLSPRTSSSVVHLRLRGRSREVAAGRGRSGECDQAAAPAHALRKGALDLADVEGGVDRAAQVDEKVGAQHLVVAGEHVHLDLDARCPPDAGPGLVSSRPGAPRRLLRFEPPIGMPTPCVK